MTGSNGCDSTATLNLIVSGVLTSTTTAVTCSNQLPYTWNGNNYNATGTYNVTLVSQSGCDSIATLNLTVNEIITSTTNASTCTNQLPYVWNGNNYNASGTYNVTLAGSNGCELDRHIKFNCEGCAYQYYERQHLCKSIALCLEWKQLQCQRFI